MSTPPDPPFLPYGRQCVEDDDVAAVVEALRSDYLTTGPRVEEFERRLAERVGAAYAVAVSTGTAALHCAYFAAGLGPGDEAIVPAVTFVATASAARYLGANIGFADVDPDSGLMTEQTLDRAAGPRTRLIVPVHLTGMPVDLKPIRERAGRAGALIVEDAAHALGATYQGEAIGACRHSDMTIFSFHPVKHVTTGEGGAVVTNDRELYQRLRLFRNHGMVSDTARLEQASAGPWYYEQQVLGYNYRISDLQCALGSSQLNKLDRFLSKRRTLARHYDELLADFDGVTPVVAEHADRESAYHLYAVLIDFSRFGMSRADLMAHLKAHGIGTQVHYIPVPTQPFYRRLGTEPERYPGANRYYERTLSLPLYPAMEPNDVQRVVAALLAPLTRRI